MQTLEKTNLDEFERLLDESFAKTYSVADIVEGTVMKKDNDGYLVSVRGAKTEAFLPNKELSSQENEDAIELGDVREFYVLKEENDEEGMVLSLKRLAFAQAWAQLNDAKVQGDTILAKVVSVVKGGVLVDVADLKGFIPSSQLRTGTPFDGLLDTKIEVKVLEADPKKNKLILSQRLAVAEQRDQVVDNILSMIQKKFCDIHHRILSKIYFIFYLNLPFFPQYPLVFLHSSLVPLRLLFHYLRHLQELHLGMYKVVS